MSRPSSKKKITTASKKGASKKRTVAASKKDASARLSLNPLRAGMPALDSIVEVRTKTLPAGAKASGGAALVSPSFRIIRTTEIDAYEKDKKDTTGATLAIAAPTGDTFKGTARKAAKTSIANGTMEPFQDLTELINSLTPDQAMIKHKPPIKTTATSGRVKEEQRNVSVRVFLYAASKEDDNDYHLILGRDPETAPEMYMNMELSGLPPEKSDAYGDLKIARDAFKDFFGGDLPGTKYDFYDPPIPVLIEGSLFFDINHAKGLRPGPQSLKSRIPTIWEVHPITKIEFNL